MSLSTSLDAPLFSCLTLTICCGSSFCFASLAFFPFVAERLIGGRGARSLWSTKDSSGKRPLRKEEETVSQGQNGEDCEGRRTGGR